MEATNRITKAGLKITQKVITTIKSLPSEESMAITLALAKEYILGVDPRESLNPTQMMLYTFIKYDIDREMKRAD